MAVFTGCCYSHLSRHHSTQAATLKEEMMFTLSLLGLSPLPKESHLVAVLVGVLAYIVDSFAMPASAATDSFATAVVTAVCWYVYKVFDGITYDGAETALGTVTGLFLSVAICVGYFMF